MNMKLVDFWFVTACILVPSESLFLTKFLLPSSGLVTRLYKVVDGPL